MKEFIEFIVKSLVDNPDAVNIDMKIGEDKKYIFTLKVAAEDVGKVIGRQGKTAVAIRTLLTAVAAKEGKRTVMEILD